MKKKLGFIFLVIAIIGFSSLILVNKQIEPFSAVLNFRGNHNNTLNQILELESEDGYILFSTGLINKENDDIYYVDYVKQGLFGDKWIGGGGHVNRNIGLDLKYKFSVQLIDESQLQEAMIIGSCKDDTIDHITMISGSEIGQAVFVNTQNKSERFFYIRNFKSANMSNNIKFNIKTSKDSKNYNVSTENMEGFKKGSYVEYFD